MTTKNNEMENAWIVKNAENITTDIRVQFFQTYEDAYAFMKEEVENRDGGLVTISEMGASVYQTNGDLEYWEIEEIDLSSALHRKTHSDKKQVISTNKYAEGVQPKEQNEKEISGMARAGSSSETGTNNERRIQIQVF